jgi:type I restriction enzyme S subunit
MSEWKETTLGELISIKHGYAFKGDFFSDIPTEYILLTPGNFNIGGGFKDEKIKYYNGGFPEEYILNPGDIIITMTDLSKSGDTLGYSAKIPNRNKNFLHNQRLGLVQIKSDKADSDFIYWLLRTKNYQKTIVNSASGSTVRHTSPSKIQEYIFSLPPIEEQKQIADILSCLDNKIDNLRRQNETLEKIAQTLFKHWFIDFEFPNDEGKPYKSSGGAMVASELGDIPEGWRVGKLGEEVETVGGGTPSTTEPSYWEDGDIYWYSPTDLTKSKTIFSLDTSKKITKLGLDKSSARLFPKYSILMTSRATIGEVTINTNYACTNQGFITLIPNSLFDTFYLFCWLKTQLTKVNLLASGSTFPELSKSDFRNFDFLIPSNHLVLGFRELLNPLFLRIETNTKQIQTLTKTRDTLLPKLMSGQIRVKD